MSEFKFDKFSRRSLVAKPQPNLSHRKLKIYKFSSSSAKTRHKRSGLSRANPRINEKRDAKNRKFKNKFDAHASKI